MIHSFDTYEFLFTTLAFYASNKKVFDEMLTKQDTMPKHEPQRTVTRSNTTTRPAKEYIRTRKTAEEELFGNSYSDVSDDTDGETSNARTSSLTCVYVYDDKPPIVESSSEIYANIS